MSLPPAVASMHVSYCSTYCTQCIYLRIYSQQYTDKDKGKLYPCDGSHGRQRTMGKEVKLSAQDVCRNCSFVGANTAIEKRNRREIAGLEILLSRRLQCTGCRKDLSGRGRRWWACNLCNKACTWDGHPTWGNVAEV
jgi:hypothetical protein